MKNVKLLSSLHFQYTVSEFLRQVSQAIFDIRNAKWVTSHIDKELISRIFYEIFYPDKKGANNISAFSFWHLIDKNRDRMMVFQTLVLRILSSFRLLSPVNDTRTIQRCSYLINDTNRFIFEHSHLCISLLRQTIWRSLVACAIWAIQRMTRAVNQDYLATSAEIWKMAETNARALLPAYNFHSPTFRNSHNLAIILTLSGPSNFSTLSVQFFTVRLYVCLTYYTTEIFI